MILRLWNLYGIANSPFFSFPDGDPRYYLDWAQRIAGGTLSDGMAFFGLPFYPYWLAFLFTVFGANLYIPLAIQALADASIAFLIGSISYFIFENLGESFRVNEKYIEVANPQLSWWLALAAGTVWALHQPAQAYAVTLMPTTLAVLSYWVVVGWIVQLKAVPPLWKIALIGIGLGIVATLVANILVLTLLVVARFWSLGTLGVQNALRTAGAAVMLLLGVAVGTSPSWIHNYFVAHEPVILSAHGGLNFYLGNQPDASGYPKMPASMDSSQSGLREDSQRIPEEVMGRKLTRTEAGNYWNKLAMQSIREDPARWLRLLLRKMRNYWNTFQYDDISVISAMSDSGLIAPGPRFGWIAVLGLPGLIAGCLMSRPTRWIAAAVLLQMISLLPVFITERYRLASVPGLLIGASVGFYWAWRWVTAAQWGRLLGCYVLPLFLAVWLVNLPTRDKSLWALDLYNSSRVLLANGDTELAGRRAEQALAFAPGNPEIEFLLGNYWMQKGDRAKARSFYQATLRQVPTHVRAWNNLGVVEIEDAHWDRARISLTNADRIFPGDAKIHYLLARTAVGMGDWPVAKSEIQKALTLDANRQEFKALHLEIEARAPAASPE